jgi:hypothetical protein
VAAGEAAEAEAGHEGHDDESDRVDVGAAEQREQPLPDDLVHEGGDTARREDGEEERVKGPSAHEPGISTALARRPGHAGPSPPTHPTHDPPRVEIPALDGGADRVK